MEDTNTQNQNSDQNQPQVASFSDEDIFNKDILEAMGAKNMSAEEKKELMQKVMDTIDLRVLARVDDQLSDEEAAKLKELSEKNDRKGFFDLMWSKGIDLNRIYVEEALIYKIQMIDLMNSRSKNG